MLLYTETFFFFLYNFSVIWMEVKNCKDDIRMSVLGCQNGFIKVTAVDSNSGLCE